MAESPGSERSSTHCAVRHGAQVLLALGGICGSVFSSDARSNAEGIGNPAPELDVIVVTARKRQENSQAVPISIMAVNGELLDRSHTLLLTDFVQLIPNMQLQFINPRQTAFSAQSRI
jgi:iron complex outermembrane receptor protein